MISILQVSFLPPMHVNFSQEASGITIIQASDPGLGQRHSEGYIIVPHPPAPEMTPASWTRTKGKIYARFASVRRRHRICGQSSGKVVRGKRQIPYDLCSIEGHSPTHVFTVPSLYHLCAKILQSHSMESSSQRSPAIFI